MMTMQTAFILLAIPIVFIIGVVIHLMIVDKRGE